MPSEHDDACVNTGQFGAGPCKACLKREIERLRWHISVHETEIEQLRGDIKERDDALDEAVALLDHLLIEGFMPDDGTSEKVEAFLARVKP